MPPSFMNVTVIIIDSRSNEHPDWVQTAIRSIRNSLEFYPVKLIVVDNRDKKNTVGYCHNKGIKEADTDWVFFVDDDDWITPDLIATTMYHASKHPNCIAVNTQMTAFTQEGDDISGVVVPRQHKGLVRRDYLLEHPFDESLEHGVDRAWFDQVKLRGDLVVNVPYHSGYYYRQHNEHRARATGNIKIVQNAGDIHFHARQSNFIEPFYKELSKEYYCTMDDRKFNPESIKGAEIVWCEWLDNDAIEIANFETDAAKILRVHAYEAFTERIFYVDFAKFDVVIFVAEHIKDFVESRIGKKIANAIVIPNGVDVEEFNYVDKKQNNKIAFAGSIERKKGIGELVLIAEHFPGYEFHCAGEYYEEDVAEYLRNKRPDNLHFHGKIHDMPKFYRDYSYVINTSMREGNPVAVLEAMACGCKPIVRNWIGARDMINPSWVWKDLGEIQTILDGEYAPERYRSFILQRYDLKTMYDKFKGIIDGIIKSRHKNAG